MNNLVSVCVLLETLGRQILLGIKHCYRHVTLMLDALALDRAGMSPHFTMATLITVRTSNHESCNIHYKFRYTFCLLTAAFTRV